MITKALMHGTSVLITTHGRRAITTAGTPVVAATVDFVERNTRVKGSKITNTVHFTDGTSIRAAASDSWIVV